MTEPRTLHLPPTPEETDLERQLAARDKFQTAFRQARQSGPIYISGISDFSFLNYNNAALADVMRGYLRSTGRDYDHVLAGEPNPLAPYLENLERRHR